MAKSKMTAEQQFELRQALHVATLDALLKSRRWQPGELIFQGGTSLHLAHGSPRFSEDLDFLVRSTLDLDAIANSVKKTLTGLRWFPAGTDLQVSKAKDENNPHAFTVALGGPNVIGAVRVKVELYKASHAAMAPVQIKVAPISKLTGLGAGARVSVPTATLPEIYADKVFAVGARPYLKPRDLFDLDHILNGEPASAVSTKDMQVRLATYPNMSIQAWLRQARDRADSLPQQADTVSADLRRWLPTIWPMDDEAAATMIASSVRALRQGIEVMEAIERETLASTDALETTSMAAGDDEAPRSNAPRG